MATNRGLNDVTPAEWDRVAREVARESKVSPSSMEEAHQILDELVDDKDMVNSPPHYTEGDIETIDYIVDVLGVWGAIEYCHGNVIKYTGSRLFNKNKPIQDCKKAIWYLDYMIQLLEKHEGRYV